MEEKNQAKQYKVSPGGSLGLLALGAVGVRKWKEVARPFREKQAAARAEEEKKKQEKEGEQNG